MTFMKKNGRGILTCLAIAIPSWLLGKIFPIVGGAVIAIVSGMIVTMVWDNKGKRNRELNGHQRLFYRQQLFYLGLEWILA